MKIERWRAAILEFTSAAKVQNPFLDVVIRASFTGPSGRVIAREAYWDGGDNYKVSFAPTELGVWRYALTAPPETGLDGATGEIECVPYTGELAIYRHGFLKVAGQGRYLAHDDDAPFFWLGDTHWGFVSGERWDESNHPQMASMFRGMVDRRAAQGFTVYQTNLRPESWGGQTHYWADGMEGTLPDVTFYQNEVDKRMQYIADRGLVNALGFAWFPSILGNPEAMKNLARYIVARYGALPMVWTLAGEVAGYNPAQREACINGWREVALLVEKLDGYGNLQTAHYTNERPFPSDYQDEPWFDFTLNQAGHGDYVISGRDFREHRKKHPDKPFVEGEGMYEFVHTLEENGARVADASMVRRVAYLSMQTGACGYTYGAQGIWDTVWEKPERADGLMNLFNPHGITWREAIDGEGAVQMGHFRAFYERVGFQKLRPFMGCFGSSMPFSDESLFGMFSSAVTASDDMRCVVLYYTSLSREGESSIRYLNNRPYTVEWFDPSQNHYQLVDDHALPVQGVLTLPKRPDNQDWLLVIRQNEP